MNTIYVPELQQHAEGHDWFKLPIDVKYNGRITAVVNGVTYPVSDLLMLRPGDLLNIVISKLRSRT